MTNEQKIRALGWEARRRGTSYGKLEISLTPGEAEKIYSRYRKAMEIQEIKPRRVPVDAGKAAPLLPDRRRSRKRRVNFDAGQAAELYREGRNDREISEALGVGHMVVWNWRRKEKLPPVLRKAIFPAGEARKLYERGMDDAKIGRKLGRSRESVRKWRKREGLPSLRGQQKRGT